MGKTSLVKKLRNKPFNLYEDQTHGIRIEHGSFLIKEQLVNVRFWDFGGQEILHTTHSFFLTEGCIYVIVLDARRDSKPDYWLKYVQSFGGKSPVLIVANKIDENPGYEFDNIFLLKKEYPFIKEFVKTSRCDGSR